MPAAMTTYVARGLVAGQHARSKQLRLGCCALHLPIIASAPLSRLACPQYLSQWVSHIGVDPSALQQLASQTPTAEAAVV